VAAGRAGLEGGGAAALREAGDRVGPTRERRAVGPRPLWESGGGGGGGQAGPGASKYLQDGGQEDGDRLFPVVPSDSWMSKAFDTVSRYILLGKLRKCGLDEWLVRWIENWLNGRAQRVGISGAESDWRPGTGGVPRGQYWTQSCSTSSSITWMKSQSVPSAGLLVTQNWEEWWIHRQAVLPSSETWTGWRVGQRGT